MINKIKRFSRFLISHKIISAIVIIVLVAGGYWWYQSFSAGSGKISYLTAPVEKGTIVSSISGSGQVSASNQIDLKSKVSENVTYVGVKNSQQVRVGTLLMAFDTTNAQKAVRNAQISLDNAKLSLEKLSDNGNITIPQNKQQAEDSLAKAYTDSFNTISNAFLDLPDVMTGLDDVLHGNEINKWNPNMDYYASGAYGFTWQEVDRLQAYKKSASDAYTKAKVDYDKNFDDYKSMTRSSDTATIEVMLTETYNTTQEVADGVKDAYNLIQLYKDLTTKYQMNIISTADTHLASLNTYTGKANVALSNILQMQSTIKNAKDSIANSDLDLHSQDLSVRSQNLSIQQAENSLADAKATLADSYIYAPYAGVVANVALNKGDSASSGAVAITLITNQSITKIPFNEVDITKVKVGQKATLTFDAIDGLSIVGQVAEIDTLGTVTQGVVNYNVKILFDTQSSQVKPGMSVTAAVITEVKQNVLMVPNSAVKNSSNQKYVQILQDGIPQQKTVEVGISNDTDTEIISGINEGDNVITQTVMSTATTTTQTQNGGIRIPGITGGGSGGTFGGGGNRTTGR